MRSRLARNALLGLTAVALAGGCDGTPDEVELPLPDTEVLIDPAAFLGAVPCGNNEGAMRSFVVTLYSYADKVGADATLVTSSIAVPCSVAARFREQVVSGRWYSAEVDGYEARAEELLPQGGLSSGSPVMLKNGVAVSPRWTALCGYAADDTLAPVQAADNTRSNVRPCRPLVDTMPAATQLSLSSAAALGSDACALAATFDVTSEDGALDNKAAVACDAEPLVFPATANQSYAVYVSAIASDDDRALGSVCQAVAKTAVTRPFNCSPLSDSGATVVSLAGVQNGDAPLCPVGGTFQLTLAGEPLHSAPLGCALAPEVGPLLGGSYSIDAAIFSKDGTPTGAATCAVEVLPGKTADAICTASAP